jgi:hypothetical protein
MTYFAGPSIMTALGLVTVIAGALLLFGALPPNRWFGLQTRRTQSDPRAWYRAHRAFGWVIVAMGLAVAVSSMWPTYPLHPVFGLTVPVLGGGAFAWVYFRYAA